MPTKSERNIDAEEKVRAQAQIHKQIQIQAASQPWALEDLFGKVAQSNELLKYAGVPFPVPMPMSEPQNLNPNPNQEQTEQTQ